MNFFQRKILVFASVISVFALLAGCGTSSGATEKKEIKFGFVAGPYSDHVKEGIKPILEKKGYKVTLTEFASDQTNAALFRSEIDANVSNSTAYLESTSKENNYDLVPLIQVPSAPLGLYSNKLKSLNDVKDGVKIGVPQDPVSLARTLKVIEKLGWGKAKEGVDILKITEKDIVPAKFKITYVPLPSAQIPRALDDLDFGFLFGGYAIASGRKLSDALASEDTPPEHRIIVAVKKGSAESKWAKDIIDAYKSPEYKKTVQDHAIFKGYVLPDYLR